MGLAEDISAFERSLTALAESHDFFTFSKRVWNLVPRTISQQGRTFSFRNSTTGSRLQGQDLAQLVRPYRDRLGSLTFQHFVSLFEDFFFDFLQLWLAAYPASLSRRQLDLNTVLSVSDKAAVILIVVEREVNELKYKRVADWFTFLEGLTRLGCPTTDEIERITEIKASRDILAHNKGIVNTIYLSKAGSRGRFSEGERLEIPESYHRESWETFRKVVRDISEAAIQKALVAT